MAGTWVTHNETNYRKLSVSLQTCSFDSLTIDINKDFVIAKMASLNSQSSVTNKKYRFGGINVWTLLKFDSSIGSRVEGL